MANTWEIRTKRSLWTRSGFAVHTVHNGFGLITVLACIFDGEKLLAVMTQVKNAANAVGATPVVRWADRHAAGIREAAFQYEVYDC